MFEDIRMDSVTCLTEQGVGDLFWTYQTLAPFYKEINFELGITGRDAIQLRAEQMGKLLPKVKNCECRMVSEEKYMEVATTKKSVQRFLEEGLNYIEYSMTPFPRDGIRMEDIDPDLPVAWDIPLPMEKPDLKFEHYIGLAVSGPGTQQISTVWRPEQYLNLIELIKATYNMPKDFPVVAMGASFDKWLMEYFGALLERDEIPHQIFIDYPWKQVFYLINHCTFFVGYQCGLNILADNMNIPQLMVWFPDLPQVPFTTAKRSNIAKGIYNATFFNRGLEDVIEYDIRIPELPGGFRREDRQG